MNRNWTLRVTSDVGTTVSESRINLTPMTGNSAFSAGASAQAAIKGVNRQSAT
jgi:hypothetical protein